MLPLIGKFHVMKFVNFQKTFNSFLEQVDKLFSYQTIFLLLLMMRDGNGDWSETSLGQLLRLSYNFLPSENLQHVCGKEECESVGKKSCFLVNRLLIKDHLDSRLEKSDDNYFMGGMLTQQFSFHSHSIAA